MDMFGGINRIYYKPNDYDFRHEPTEFSLSPMPSFEKEEEDMGLTKQFKFENKTEEDKKAIELEALKDDGTLTEAGKDLLLNILLAEPDIREKFDNAISQIYGEE